jgi:arsenite methyltransferase
VTANSRSEIAAGTEPEALKACCAAVYGQDVVALLLGDSYHPGGLALTRRLARLLELGPGERVLDVASGPGTTAFLLAEEFAANVDGVDLGERSVARAREAAAARGLESHARFRVGDAERLPFDDGTFDALVCECAFCTFPDKATAAAEFARVLRSGGRLGITDVTLDPASLDPPLTTLAGYVSCIADARPAGEYEALLAACGFRIALSEAHDEALARMIEQIDARLRALSLLPPPGFEVDIDSILHYTAAATAAVTDGVAGYQLIVARKPSAPPGADLGAPAGPPTRQGSGCHECR